MEEQTDGRMDGWKNRKFPHSTGLRPLSEPLPKNHALKTPTTSNIQRRHHMLAFPHKNANIRYLLVFTFHYFQFQMLSIIAEII